MLGLTKLLPSLKGNKVVRRIVYLLSLFILWVAIIVPTYLVYKGEIADTNLLPLSPIPNFNQYVNVSARLAAINPIESSFQMTLDLDAVTNGPEGNGQAPLDLFSVVNGERRLKSPVTIFVQSTSKTFGVNERLGSLSITIPFESGNIISYPFDQHQSSIDITAQIGNPTNNPNATFIPVPLRLTVDGAVPGFSLREFSVFADEGRGFASMFVSLTIGRSGTTKGFSIFIVVLTWFLSLIMGWLSIQVVRLKRPVEAPMLASPCALLFALPSLRNVQPGVPSIGVTVDIVGFFWNMAIVAMSAILIILYFVLRWAPPAPAPSANTSPPMDAPPKRPDRNSADTLPYGRDTLERKQPSSGAGSPAEEEWRYPPTLQVSHDDPPAPSRLHHREAYSLKDFSPVSSRRPSLSPMTSPPQRFANADAFSNSPRLQNVAMRQQQHNRG
ncbi:hypothetical protein BCR44DRAFT_1424802 [Catenaria anguillulae PL171]|uniref:Uncharacterized protein n=1 Tax=Catenaria anguillulae PL171 TaxID=765915 RepID=A0A1Y2I0C3_9FUNG|nr:hypothetical protein BCR44DRAFT_1424802 [Catenaria anguillulae PL171]